MNRLTLLFAAAVVLAVGAAAVGAQAPVGGTGAAGIARAAQPPQETFVPVDELPPEEQLPAAPLLVAAYAFVWVALLVYLWSIWRRLGRVQGELAALSRGAGERQRSG